MNRLDCAIINILKLFMGISVFLLAIVTALQVIARYVFSSPLAWGQDVIRLSFIYLVFLGSAYCVSSNEHLGIDIFLSKLKGKFKIILMAIINILLLVFFSFLAYWGYDFTCSGYNQMAPYLRIPMSVYYAALPLSALFMIYFQIRNIVKERKGNV